MTAIEAVVLVIVVIVCVFWDALIVYQIWRGETVPVSSGSRLELPRRISRKTAPVMFWLVIGVQLIVANGAILYLLVFAFSSLS